MKLKIGRINMDQIARIIVLIVADMVLIILSYIIATWLPFSGEENHYQFPFYVNGVIAFSYLQLLIYTTIYIATFASFRMYSKNWLEGLSTENIYVLAAVGVGTGLIFAVNVLFGNEYKLSLFLAGVLLIPLLFIERYAFRSLQRTRRLILNRQNSGKTPLLIVGAGFFGKYVQAQIMAGIVKGSSYVAAFVDDDPKKIGTRIRGVKVVGKTSEIPEIVNRLGIREIILAIPSISEARQIELVALCKSTKCRVRMVSPLRDMDTQPTMRDIREISVDDILFRPEVKLDKESIAEYIQHKTVLVTGGGGSIGSEICRQTAMFYPSRLVIFDIYENNAYEILMEFKRKYPWLNVSVRIGSVREKSRVDEVMAEFSPDLVVHCAAHKHVPLMEDSPAEAIKNNVIGTYNVIRSAGEHGVKRFVQLSTDKAVNPTNVMGASKRVTELIVQDYAKRSPMQCMTVRFGNVLGSYGSVIPLFESQIRSGGPVQVTHPDITRYFMTIPEAAQLVLQAGALGESGAIYVLNMGSPVRIMDLAEKLIRYYGYTPNEDMPIEIIGLRPGEKMYEELTLDEEEQSLLETSHNRIFRTQPLPIDSEAFPAKLNALMEASLKNDPALMDLLLELVPNYCCAKKEKTNNA
ncbi:MAG: nucleoside-diphosphate sugar epimerase/dehydratase [Eubacteriales bacterium]|nr:nucleoside-diphosphate sugar epimerase/dehydratase [Eubacteriales bacterium]